MTAPKPSNERRRAPRALAEFPIRFSEDPAAEPATLRDISEIGLACSSPREVPEMTVVGLNFALPGIDGEHSVTGAVVRCDSQSDGKYDLAVFFTEIPEPTASALSQFVSRGNPAP